MYTCGPTVYDYTHIGHLRKYVGDDILRRVLNSSGYQVKHVMNITDVGHLVSDEDSGEDKMEKGARESGRTVWEVAKFYEDYFWYSVSKVNIERPNIVAKATEHIKEQIKLIHKLEKKGFIYKTDHAIYFDISKFPNYTKLSGQKLEEKEIGARSGVFVDKQKLNPQDFALWFFTVGHFKDHTMRWPSSLGEGFPGWHIECSAMSMEYLGNTLDIHTGGVDHISVHHTNEIAQSEAATGSQFVKFWVHHEFLLVSGEKMSKSKKNFYRIDEVINRGFDPLALRYLFLTTHYKAKLNFTWDSLNSSQNALNNLRQIIREWDQPKIGCAQFEKDFKQALNNDLNIPQALAVLWNLIKSDYPTSAKAQTVLKMDKILGLGLEEYLGKKVEIPKEVQRLINQREKARQKRDFKQSDKIRKEIKKLGFKIEDTPSGSEVKGEFTEDIITIDGPTSSGKNSVGFLLSKKLGYQYIDTGMIYRAGCLKMLNQNASEDDLEKILDIFKNLDVKFETNDKWKMFLGSIDVTDDLHTPQISRLVPIVAAIPQVREIMKRLQRKLGKNNKIVMGGRDIGSEIYPEAKNKFFLTAKTKVRAKRRFKQLLESNPEIRYEDVNKDMEDRDKQDMEREASPLRIPQNAVIIDNSDMSVEQTVEEMLICIRLHN